MILKSISKSNRWAYLWHAAFLALAQSFMDVDTIVPAMMVDAGGSSMQIGILTAILVGGTGFSQLLFTPFLGSHKRKKKDLLLGIYLRVAALFLLALLLFQISGKSENGLIILAVFVLGSVFSISGAFAAISYSDILGRSVLSDERKSFYATRQIIASSGVIISAFFAGKLLTSLSYPTNYAWLFSIAALSLAVASIGFLRIKEVEGPAIFLKSFGRYFSAIYQEIKNNRKIRYYLLLVNFLGVSMVLLPFLVLYGKTMYQVDNSFVWNLLILKVVAGVLTGFLILGLSKRIKYTPLLYSIAAVVLLVLIVMILFPSQAMLQVSFFLGGVVFASYRVVMEGVLLEVSDHKNRTLNIGMVGAGNIIPLVFPIIGGYLIGAFGFPVFFGVFFILLLVSLYYIKALNCKK